MKKPKTTLTPQPQLYSHQNDEFNTLPPPPPFDTLRFNDELNEERETTLILDGDEQPQPPPQQQQPEPEGEEEEDVEEGEGEGEDEYEDDEYDDCDEEDEEDGDGDGEGGDYGSIEGKAAEETASRTMTERKKLADGFFEVEFIRRKRVCKGERQYLIKWRGWPESANTWEPVDHLQTCPDVVEAFEESLRSGQKKISRKRKRKFTQPKKKMQYSYGVSKKHDEVVKRPRAAKSIDGKGSETASPHVASNERENGDPLYDQKSSGKNLDMRLQQPLTVDGDGPENCQSNANCGEGDQSNLRRGAKRRKSGSVRRFTPDMTSFSFDYYANAAPNISSCDRVEELMLGNSDGYRKKKFDSSRGSTVITRLIKPISYSASVTNNVQDVSVTFMAMRSDGKEVMVDNKFLKANNPLLLINFYEQHLRYNPN